MVGWKPSLPGSPTASTADLRGHLARAWRPSRPAARHQVAVQDLAAEFQQSEPAPRSST
jgi:hypothetical protein